MGSHSFGRLLSRLGLAAALLSTMSLVACGDVSIEGTAARELLASDSAVKQTEVEAVSTAARAGRAVEIGAFRGERREVWANPDGTFTETHHQQPVRTVQGGKWVPIDPTLARRPDGSVTPEATAIGLRLSGGGNSSLATFERAGRRVDLIWPKPLPVPSLAGDTATYADVLPGVDLVVHSGAAGFSHVFVVKTRAAAAQPEITNLSLGLKTTGLAVRSSSDGRLAAVDSATGGAVFEAPAPTMWDSGSPAETKTGVRATGERPTRFAPESARRARLGVRVAAGKLHLTPDRSMLSDPAIRFPLMIDPHWQGTSQGPGKVLSGGS